MTNPTPMNELCALQRKIKAGAATPGDKERAAVLLDRMIAPAVARAVSEVQPQIDAALARRRAAQWARRQHPTPRR